jgi:hypothetical protein
MTVQALSLRRRGRRLTGYFRCCGFEPSSRGALILGPLDPLPTCRLARHHQAALTLHVYSA